MQSWWLADLWQHNPVVAISWIFWVVFSICCHELGHGYAAIRKGDDTPIVSGHMTWNPMVHMGGFSLIMLLVAGIAWGAMPVNPNQLRGRHADAYVAAAGPAVNLFFFVLCAILAIIWSLVPQFLGDEPTENIHKFLFTGCALNIVLMLFNLLPVPPLDGSRIIASFFRPYEEFVYSEKGAVVSLIAFVLVFSVVGRYVAAFGFMVASIVVGGGIRVLSPLFGGTP